MNDRPPAAGGRPQGLKAPSPNYGAFGTEEAVLSAIIARLVGALNPEAIYLIGSRARGDATPYSDFDILLVMSTDGEQAAIDPADAYAPLLGLGIACDVLACSRDDFEREKLEKTGICRTAAREGRLVYERRR